MRQLNKTELPRPSGDSHRLISLSIEMFYASTYLESKFCRKKLEALVLKLLQAKKQSTLNAAIDYLFTVDMEAYNCLLEVTESLSETVILEENGKRYQALLVAVPILAWTRYTIASGELTSELTEKIRHCLLEHVFADDVRVAVAPGLYAVDQLPYSHIDVQAVTQRLAGMVLGGPRFEWAPRQETVQFLADGRYLLAVAMGEEEKPLFRWQSISDGSSFEVAKENCLKQWKHAIMPLLSEMMPGCNLEPLLPGGFFNTCRKTDQEIRPAIIKAAVHYLMYALDVTPDNLCAVIGGFGKDADSNQIEEYRISFYINGHEKIVYGVVWPLYSVAELESVKFPSSLEMHSDMASGKKYIQLLQIFKILRDLGVLFEKHPIERFLSEFCEDCGAPLFVDTHGELVHAEMPEDTQKEVQLH